jgi:hypothetical protein
MKASNQIASQRDRWANELWNVSLFPSPSLPAPANELVHSERHLRLTPKNTDEPRSDSSAARPLRVIARASGDTLV